MNQSRTTERKTRVYIAGPYSHGDPCVNTHAAIQAANTLLDGGYAPFVPHLNHLWHTISPRPYEDWTDLDNQFLICCDAVLRLPGESPGADQETGLARRNGLPVYDSVEALAQGMPTSQSAAANGVYPLLQGFENVKAKITELLDALDRGERPTRKWTTKLRSLVGAIPSAPRVDVDWVCAREVRDYLQKRDAPSVPTTEELHAVMTKAVHEFTLSEKDRKVLEMFETKIPGRYYLDSKK